MAEHEVTMPWQPLRDLAQELFMRAGMSVENAGIEADVLIWANLRGVDSHGILRVPIYVKNLETGIYNPRPEIRVIRETAAALFVDADRALGPVASVPTTKKIVAKAREAGICWGMVRNSGHQGAIGYYAQMIAQEGMAAMTWTCNPPNMAPTGARARWRAQQPYRYGRAAGGSSPAVAGYGHERRGWRQAGNWPRTRASPSRSAGRWISMATRPPTRSRARCCYPPPDTRAMAWR